MTHAPDALIYFDFVRSFGFTVNHFLTFELVSKKPADNLADAREGRHIQTGQKQGPMAGNGNQTDKQAATADDVALKLALRMLDAEAVVLDDGGRIVASPGASPDAHGAPEGDDWLAQWDGADRAALAAAIQGPCDREVAVRARRTGASVDSYVMVAPRGGGRAIAIAPRPGPRLPTAISETFHAIGNQVTVLAAFARLVRRRSDAADNIAATAGELDNAVAGLQSSLLSLRGLVLSHLKGVDLGNDLSHGPDKMQNDCMN